MGGKRKRPLTEKSTKVSMKEERRFGTSSQILTVDEVGREREECGGQVGGWWVKEEREGWGDNFLF